MGSARAPGGHGLSYQILDHTADTGIEVWGNTPDDLFQHAAEGMFALMFSRGDPALDSVTVTLSAGSLPELMVEWLSELLFLSESRELAFSHFGVRVVDHSLQAVVAGRAYGASELIGPPIKAVTYHQLEVHENQGGWHALVIFDV